MRIRFLDSARRNGEFPRVKGQCARPEKAASYGPKVSAFWLFASQWQNFQGAALAGPRATSNSWAAMRTYLDFEKPVAELEAKVFELRELAEKGDAVAISDELSRLEAKAEKALAELYAALTPWQKTQVARHPAISYAACAFPSMPYPY